MRLRVKRGPHVGYAVRAAAGWQSGHAAACKAVDAGSIPTPASNAPYEDPAIDRSASHFHSARQSVAVLARSPVAAYGGGK